MMRYGKKEEKFINGWKDPEGKKDIKGCLANGIPKEVAEQNKQLAIYRIASLDALYADEVKKMSNEVLRCNNCGSTEIVVSPHSRIGKCKSCGAFVL